MCICVCVWQGTAVLWYNLKRNGEGDMRVVHAGCPVLYGDKWGEQGHTHTLSILVFSKAKAPYLHWFLLSDTSTEMPECVFIFFNVTY